MQAVMDVEPDVTEFEPLQFEAGMTAYFRTCIFSTLQLVLVVKSMDLYVRRLG